MPGSTTLIIAGGARPDPLVVGALPEIDRCIAADSGADLALAVGLEVDVVIGDLDSISEAGLERVREAGAEVRSFPSEKDATDLELAIALAHEQTIDRLIIIGLAGGRLDHELANIGALAAAARRGVEVDGLIGSARLAVVQGRRSLEGALGETLSLLPVLGRVAEVTTTGLEYELRAEPLEAGSARGMSNRFIAREATIQVGGGILIAVQPFALREHGRT